MFKLLWTCYWYLISGLRQLCSKFCQIFYSALPRKCFDNSSDLVWLYSFKKVIIAHILHMSSGQLHSSSPRNQILPDLCRHWNLYCDCMPPLKLLLVPSLSTAKLCHHVTCSEHYLEKPCNVALFPHLFPHNPETSHYLNSTYMWVLVASSTLLLNILKSVLSNNPFCRHYPCPCT